MREGFKSIFQKFSEIESKEAVSLLKSRWKLNKLDINIIKNKKILDIGCGSGRYTFALKEMGAREITAVDIFNKPANWPKDIKYIKTELSKLPFKNEEFDFIFCNGSISHNKKWKGSIKEYRRVLKKNGWLFLSLFGSGNHWKSVDKVRKKLTGLKPNYFEEALLLRDWKPNKVFFLIDLFFIDRVYFTKNLINDYLKKIKFKKIIFLKRGVKKDLNEKIFQNPKLRKIYGEGEIRLITKK